MWSLQEFAVKNNQLYQAWWLAPVVPALGRPREEHCHEFVADFGYSITSLPK